MVDGYFGIFVKDEKTLVLVCFLGGFDLMLDALDSRFPRIFDPVNLWVERLAFDFFATRR